jgi:hypothetical protein
MRRLRAGFVTPHSGGPGAPLGRHYGRSARSFAGLGLRQRFRRGLRGASGVEPALQEPPPAPAQKPGNAGPGTEKPHVERRKATRAKRKARARRKGGGSWLRLSALHALAFSLCGGRRKEKLGRKRAARTRNHVQKSFRGNHNDANATQDSRRQATRAGASAAPDRRQSPRRTSRAAQLVLAFPDVDGLPRQGLHARPCLPRRCRAMPARALASAGAATPQGPAAKNLGVYGKWHVAARGRGGG